jgi:hypothetical protein
MNDRNESSLAQEPMAYVGFKSCGHAAAAAVDAPAFAKANAKEVAGWLRDGLRVERRTVAWVRENLRFCDCAKPTPEKSDANG